MKKKLNKEQRQAIAAAFDGLNWHDPVERNAVATEIVRMVVTDIYNQDIISEIADVETFGPGEELQFQTLDEMLAYVIEPGSYLPRTVLTKKAITLPKHRIGVATNLDLRQLRSGRYGTIMDLRRKATEALLGARNKLVWDTLVASITSSDGNYATFTSGDTVTTKKAALDAAITYVHDNSNNGPVAIMGRFKDLAWIEDIDGSKWFSDTRKDEVLNTGFLGIYKGVPIFRMRSYKDRNEDQKIADNHIMVVSEGTVKFGEVEPGLEVYDQLRGTENLSWEVAFWEEYGAAILEPEKNYHLQIT